MATGYSSDSSDSDWEPQAYTREGKPFPDASNHASLHRSTSQAYSVQDIYGDLDENQINLARTQTRNSILRTLSERAENRLDGSTPSDSDKEMDEPSPIKDHGLEFASMDPELITWEGPDDPQYPRNWSNTRKWVSTTLVSLYTFVSPVSSSMLSPAMTEISSDFGVQKQVISSLMVSIFILAWALAPLVVAPLSELYGRKIVLDVSIVFLFFFNLACGLSRTTAQMCVFRFLGGFSGAAPLSIGAGVLGDLFDDRSRGTAMAFYALGPLLGPTVAPIMSGFIVENLGWRWVFWILCILNGFAAVCGILFYRETYSPVLLKWKAKKLRKESGNANLKTIYDIADGETVLSRFTLNIKRPITLLFTHPMVIGLGSFMAFTYGFMYLLVCTFPSLWSEVYGFNKGITGLMFAPLGVGFMLGLVVWARLVDLVYYRLTAKNGGVAKPEYRLPLLIFAGIGIPIGLVWYGWSAQKHLHWIMPSIGCGIFGFSLVVVFQAIQNYLIDMNPRFSASSVAAAAVFRSFFGFAFPLFAPFMYDKLGYGWGNTMCAFIALALGIPFPIFVLKYGERMRFWANRRLARDQAKRDARNLKRLQKLE